MTGRAGGAVGETPHHRAALDGLKVVEFAQLVAGPLAGTLLADLGADVVHVEDPNAGDPARTSGEHKDGAYLWWKVLGRNKRSATLDLRQPAGQDVARRLAGWADVVITNLRPGTLEAWGLDWPSLHQQNRQLVMLQISGYGATTTMRDAPGFGKVGEARSGVVHITGFPDGPPVHSGFSHADTVTALMGAFAVQTALYRKHNDPRFDGEWIDLAIDEALFRLIEWQVVMFDQLGVIPQRVGNGIPGAPSAVVNVFKSSDCRWITVTSGTVRSVQNIARMLSLPIDRYATPELIAAGRHDLESALTSWMRSRPASESLAEMSRCGVVAAPILDVAQIASDPTFAERGSIVTVDDPELGPLRMQGVIPRLSNHAGDIWSLAPGLGEHNFEVYCGDLSMSPSEYAALVAARVVG